MKFHVVAGMPRAGSTLLCNILNQNPRFHASSTSCVAQTARVVSNLWSKSPEVKSERIVDEVGTDARMVNSIRAMIEAWYDDQAEVVFDKCRFWNMNAMLLGQLFPEAQMLVCVRDLRAIFASVEKQNDKNPMLDEAGNSEQLTKFNRANRMFGDKGLIGQQIMGIDDMIRRAPAHADREGYCHPIQYETFVRSPQMIMDRIYAALKEDPFEHDFNNVVNTATDVDALYNSKFPHRGDGKVEVRPDEWKRYVPSDIAGMIMGKFTNYNKTFGYQ